MSLKHSVEDAAIYRRCASGDRVARNAMAERHLGLVQKLATYYAKRNPHLHMDDLIQEGRIGVVVALEKFNVDKGFKFSTYATWWIKHYIQRYMVENHSGGATAPKKDTEAYIARDANVMPDLDRALYESRCIDHTSMSATTPNGTDINEIVADRDAHPIEEQSGIRLEWLRVEEVLFHESISARQRSVVCMRYGVMGLKAHTIGEVANELGIRSQIVTKVEQAAIEQLAILLEENDEHGDGDEAVDSGEAGGEAASEARERADVHSEEDGAGGSPDRAGVA